MSVNIISNGSKWNGQEPDTIDCLLGRLANYALDRSFEEYGNFVITEDSVLEPATVRFFGNFLELSAVFSIDTDEPELIAKLTTAIRANQKRLDYTSQHKPKKIRRRA